MIFFPQKQKNKEITLQQLLAKIQTSICFYFVFFDKTLITNIGINWKSTWVLHSRKLQWIRCKQFTNNTSVYRLIDTTKYAENRS